MRTAIIYTTLTIMLLASCGKSNNQLKQQVEESFGKYRKGYEFLKSFINAETDSISSISIAKDRIRITKFYSFRPIDIISIEELKTNKRIGQPELVLDCIEVMKALDIRLIGGSKYGIQIGFTDSGFGNCYHFSHAEDFDPTEQATAKRISRFEKDEKPWIYVVEGNWYLEKTQCLN